MKTSIKTFITSTLTAIFLSTTALTVIASDPEKKPLKTYTISHFRRISVTGNVEVKLIQRKNHGVIYAEDNTGIAKIIQEGDRLIISSSNNQPVKIIVYVNDIFRIEAAGNAIVKTDGKLSTQFLQIFLKGNAHAEINTSTEGLYTVINDRADLKLSGSTDQHTLVMGKSQKLTIDKFAALKTNISSIENDGIEKELASIN